MNYDQWYAKGVELSRIYHRTRIEIADWLVQGENLFPEQYAQAVDVLKLSPGTVMNYISAARRCPPSARPTDPEHKLTITDLQAVAPMSGYDPAQRDLLSGVISGAIADRDVLREEVKAFMAIINPTPDIPDDSEPDITPALVGQWNELETIEITAGEVGSLWTRITRLISALAKGDLVRIRVERLAAFVDSETGEVVRHVV